MADRPGHSRKVMMLGDIGVGKTSLARRMVFDRFETDYKATIGVDLYTCDVRFELRGATHSVELIIWDIDGDFGESVFNRIYIRGASGALVVGDVTRPSTRESMVRLGDRFQEELPGRPIAFVVNKTDLASDPAEIVLPAALETPRIPLVRTSAKSGENVERAFQTLAGAIMERGL